MSVPVSPATTTTSSSSAPTTVTDTPPSHQQQEEPTQSEDEQQEDDVEYTCATAPPQCTGSVCLPQAVSTDEEKQVNVVGIVLPLVLLGLPVLVTLVIVIWCYVSRRYSSLRRSIRRRRKDPRKTLDRLLQPAHSGFTRIKTYDSESDDNADVTIFQKTQDSFSVST